MEVKASHKLEVQQSYIKLIGPSHSLASASRSNIELIYTSRVIIPIYIGYLTLVYLARNILGDYFPTVQGCLQSRLTSLHPKEIV